jgi:hypothetical protein
MTTTAGFPPSAKINFPGPIGTKRRRMRSGGGNVSVGSSQNHNNANHPQLSLEDLDELSADGKTTQTSNCKGATTIPLFLKSKWSRRTGFDVKA